MESYKQNIDDSNETITSKYFGKYLYLYSNINNILTSKTDTRIKNDNYFNNYYDITKLFRFGLLQLHNMNINIIPLNKNYYKIQYKNKKKDIYINKIPFGKYIPSSFIFFTYYDLLYNKINISNTLNICEISSYPGAFETIEYFKYYLNMNNINTITLYTFTYNNYLNMTKDKYITYLKYLNNYMKLTKYYIDHTPSIKCNFLILNLAPPIKIPYLISSQSNNIILEQIQYLSLLEKNGTCLFYIGDIINDNVVNHIIQIHSFFKNIDIIVSPLRQFVKICGIYLYCTEYGNYDINKNTIIQKIKDFNYNHYKERYYKCIEYKRFVLNPNIEEQKIKTILYTFEWCKSHNFKIFESWYDYLNDSFGNDILTYLNEHQENIIYNITSSSNKKNNKIIPDDMINYINNKLYSIQHKIDTRNIVTYVNAKKYIRLYRNPTYSLYKYIENIYGIPNVTQAWCKMYEMLHILHNDLKILSINSELKSFHLCEMPGNFISALFYFIQLNNIQTKWSWIGQSLVESKISDEYGYVKKYKDNWDLYNGGDLLNKRIQSYYMKKYKKLDFITSDCGIENNLNQESNNTLQLLHNIELEMILKMLNIGGSFIAKKFIYIHDKTVLKLLYKLLCKFKYLYCIKSQLNAYSAEYYIIGINKLKKQVKYDYNLFLNNMNNFLLDFLKLNEFIIDMQLYFTDNITKMKQKNKDFLVETIKRKNKEWCKYVRLSRPKQLF